MTDRTNISFHSAPDFVEFVKRHGLISPREDAPVVFKLQHQSDEHHNRRNGYENEGPVFQQYEAPVQLFDKTAYAIFSALPKAPLYWAHDAEKRIQRELASKKDVVEALLSLGVTKENLRAFDKVKVSKLEELVDSSPSDNSNIEELLLRETKTPPDTLTFKLKDQIVDQVQVKMSKERHGSTLHYTLVADFSKHWIDRETAIEKAVSDAKFRVYSGSLAS